MKFYSTKKFSYILLGMTLGLSWIFYMYTSDFDFIIIISLIAFTILLFKKWYLSLILLVSVPWTIIPSINFIQTIREYNAGKATWMSSGMPAPEFYNLDKELRVWNSTSGCMISGNEWMTHGPNNYAIKMMHRIYGDQQGIYTGFYPDKEATARIIDSTNNPVPYIRKEENYEFKIGKDSFKISDPEFRTMDTTQFLMAKAIFLNNELLIFKPLNQFSENITYLADKDGKVFARYYQY